MSMTPRPPIPSFIPESAPFTAEQRTWLNGLFAGLFGLEETVTPLSAAEVAKLLPGLLAGAASAGRKPDGREVDDGAPWHDPAMPLPDRMKLAESQPLPRRLMAAMAQQDCGQCGYNCNDYANVLFAKSEKRLNLCVPGGKETSRMLKQLYQELESTPAEAAPVPAPAKIDADCAARTRARHSYLCNLPVAPAAEQSRVAEGNMAHRYRSCRDRSRLCGRRFVRDLSRQRSRAG